MKGYDNKLKVLKDEKTRLEFLIKAKDLKTKESDSLQLNQVSELKENSSNVDNQREKNGPLIHENAANQQFHNEYLIKQSQFINHNQEEWDNLHVNNRFTG